MNFNLILFNNLIMWQNMYDKCSFWLLVLLITVFKISELLLIENKNLIDWIAFLNYVLAVPASGKYKSVDVCFLFYKMIGRP